MISWVACINVQPVSTLDFFLPTAAEMMKFDIMNQRTMHIAADGWHVRLSIIAVWQTQAKMIIKEIEIHK